MKAAATLGKIKSDKRIQAARINGHKGGRPGLYKRVDIDENHIYTRDGKEFPAVSKVLDHVGYKGFYPKGSLAFVRGEKVHDAISEYLSGGVVFDWVDIIAKVRAWLDLYEITIEAVEVPACREFPDIAGTADALGKIAGERLVIDWKTGAKNPRHIWQVMLYCYIFGCKKAYLYYVDLDKTIIVQYDKIKIDSLLKWYYNKSSTSVKGVK